MSQLYDYIYNANILLLCLVGLLILGGWTWLMATLQEKIRRWVGTCAMLVALGLIVGKTLVNRRVEQGLYFPQWNPLHSVILYWNQPQQWRAMFMNILLFAPLGGALPYLLPGTPIRRVWAAVGIACALSFAIECVQQLTLIGCLQTEDWLLNTIGAFIGAVAYFACTALSKRAEEINFVK